MKGTQDFLEDFIQDLLHLEEGSGNLLIDLGDTACRGRSLSNTRTFLLHLSGEGDGEYMISTARERRGKPSNRTVLKGSSVVSAPDAGIFAKWEWKDLNGDTDVKSLHLFLDKYYSELNLKGNNPLFLSVGALKWTIGEAGEPREVCSPLLIYPIRLNRGASTSPVEIEFVDDDAYFNPCLIALMQKLYPTVAEGFPHPNGAGADFDDPVDPEKLSDGSGYFAQVEAYLGGCVNLGTQSFTLCKDTVAIGLYHHSDICMYYDVRRNRALIDGDELTKRIFSAAGQCSPKPMPPAAGLRFILPKDRVQEELIGRVAAGESLVIKGPPGTGKTLTIANMIAVLLAQGKRVMFASKKISALSEVSNKLPENLRKFVLMLAYETEKQASAVDPVSLKKEFREMLRFRREYTFDDSVYVKLEAAQKKKTEAMLKLDGYVRQAFLRREIFGMSYYDALDAYYGNVGLPLVPFCGEREAVLALTAQEIEELKACANDAGKHLSVLGREGAAGMDPWMNVSPSADVDGKLYPAFEEICTLLRSFLSDADAQEKMRGISLDILPSDLVIAIGGQEVLPQREAAEALNRIAGLAADGSRRDGMLARLSEYLGAREKDPAPVTFRDGFEGDLSSLAGADMDVSLPYPELLRIDAFKPVLYADGALVMGDADTEELYKAALTVSLKRQEERTARLKVYAAFDLLPREIPSKTRGLLLKAYDAVQGRDGKLSFTAKRLFGKLRKLSSGPLGDASILEAVKEYRICESASETVRMTVKLLSVLLKRELSEEDCDVLLLTLDRSRTLGVPLVRYLEGVGRACALLKEGVTVSSSVTLKDIADAYRLHVCAQELEAETKKLFGDAGVPYPDSDLLPLARITYAALRLGGIGELQKGQDLRLLFLQALTSLKKDAVAALRGAISCLKKAGGLIVNYYTARPGKLTVGDLRFFSVRALDKSTAGAAISYSAVMERIQTIFPCRKLFEALEWGRAAVPFSKTADYLEHNFLHEAIEAYAAGLGAARYVYGRQEEELELRKYSEAEEEIFKLNARIIEKECILPVDPEDDDFSFLAGDRGVRYTMRGIFKACDAAIFKLKRCFILSPSSASVLFRTPVYNDFDVVIVDEASQLEPVYLIPLLFRAKQCVLVGDEHQMPPIAHFKAKKAELIRDYENELTLDPNISALSLALSCGAFNYAELCCHYRSNTESLIAFSQEAFYPHMRTFPAARPYGDGLGFEDVFVEDGFCDGGVNAAEAKKTVELLNRHFGKYFLEESGTLAEGHSVGVVAFGEAQLEAIKRLVNADAALSERIARAQRGVDVPEKAVFFRTIESVQGQEIDHLILSLTYGRDKNGKAQNRFGELNRDDFGKCIFNVAVTRAKSSVTLVRSVHPHELDNAGRIGFIVEYMQLVQRFAGGGARQFVGNRFERGEHFVEHVAAFLASLGIDEDRIVIGYGVTKGSVQIPVAVLSKDKKEAVFGVWCELPTEGKYDYIDYHLHDYDSLCARGWRLHRIYLHNWYDNAEAEQRLLRQKIENLGIN